jgi:hypothetical protein
MSFLRPELAAAVARRREALTWGVVLALGLLAAWRGYVRYDLIMLAGGTLAAVAGVALLRLALLRERLRAAPEPGVVLVDEGRIGLMGPEAGGFVDLDGLLEVAVTGAPDRAWRLTGEEGVLVVPFGALGAEALPDVLAALPGIDLEAASQGPAVIWRRRSRIAGGG